MASPQFNEVALEQSKTPLLFPTVEGPETSMGQAGAIDSSEVAFSLSTSKVLNIISSANPIHPPSACA